ncbi:MAG: SPOR domain-containing protein [Candidatus Omnitrophica bacterium]|nr:SPOR domain-containing protein [Candidatus Omnitrophota bacterium]
MERDGSQTGAEPSLLFIKMEGQTNSQLELFSKTAAYGDSARGASNKPFLAFIWNYEKTILTIIGIIFISIISFSLGVEKGKKISASKNNSFFDIASNQLQEKNKPIEKQASSQIKVLEQKEQGQFLVARKIGITNDLSSLTQKQGFTIQLASFKTKALAQKEAGALEKKGFSTLILTKGKYMVLCVGKFPKKETAQSSLSELRKRYKDCYIRRL